MANGGNTKIWESLLQSVRSAVHLKVVTYIGEVEVSGDVCEPKVQFSTAQTEHSAYVTCIDLVQGDVTSCIPEDGGSEKRSWVLSYHQDQVKLGKEIVHGNLKLIADFGGRLAKAINELKAIEG